MVLAYKAGQEEGVWSVSILVFRNVDKTVAVRLMIVVPYHIVKVLNAPRKKCQKQQNRSRKKGQSVARVDR